MSLHALPFMTTIMKNALMRVPGNLEEAAAVSGAGFSKRLKQVLFAACDRQLCNCDAPRLC